MLALVGSRIQEYVSDRAAQLNWNYDSPGAWHDFKVGFGKLVGITPNPVLTPAQQAELTALQGIVRTRVNALAFPENYNPMLQQLDLLRNGGPLTSASYLVANQLGASPQAQLTVSRFASGVSGAIGAIGGAYGAKQGMPIGMLGTHVPKMLPGTGNTSPTTTWYRVQGGAGTTTSQQRVMLDANNNVVINGRGNLSISAVNEEHARYFQSLRPGSTITAFETPNWMFDLVQEQAIFSANARVNPLNQGGLAPKIVDANQPGIKFELPHPLGQWLQETAIPGSGRILP